jgi:MerR family transcriptional regulator, light-induced transcriptional regulator
VSGASIRVVVNRTGIPADTLRIWERRYGFPKPERRPGGSRVYSDEDILRLLLVNRALAEGYRPGEVVPLSRAELERMVGTAEPIITSAAAAAPVSVEAIADALASDDVERVRALLRTAAVTLGPKAFVTEIAHPFAVRVGDLWAEGAIDVRHEHLASEYLTTQLRLLLGAQEDGVRRPVVVLATLPGEPHALGLEMVAVYLAASLAAPRLLGADTPPAEIAAAAEAMSADAVGLSISLAADPRRAQADARTVARLLRPGTELWLGGAGAANLDVKASGSKGATVRKIGDFTDLDRALER